MKTLTSTIVCLILAAVAVGCNASSSADASGGDAPSGISQPGGQDFGQFRQILEAGGIPGPSTLDAIGFFNEHKLDFPAADCGQDVCLHGLLGHAGNMITGSTCTVIQIGLNSPLRPGAERRPPLDLILAIDTSGSMRGDSMDAVRAGLIRMLDNLAPLDRVTLVTYADHATVQAEAVDADGRRGLARIIAGLEPGGRTHLFDGLFTAFELAAEQRDAGRETRVVLLSDGVATEGIEDPVRIRGLVEGYARTGIGVTTIGVGEEFDAELMRSIAEAGGGNFYFLEDPQAVEEVFTEEVQTFLFPVALDVEIEVEAASGYLLTRAYGTRGWRGGATGGTIRVPSLFLAGRTSASEPIDAGRRGGGGAILVELVPDPRRREAAAGRVGRLTLRYTHPLSGERLEQVVSVESPHAPTGAPAGGYFSDATVEKGFVMLNLFAGFEMASDLADDGDPGAARGVLEALLREVSAWLERRADPDIEDDLRYVELFIANLEEMEVQTPVSRPPEPWPVD